MEVTCGSICKKCYERAELAGDRALGAASEQVGEAREGTPASEALKLKLRGGRKVSQAQDMRRGG